MKILHVNFSDSIGGASRAAYRIHRALRTVGVDSRMCVAVAKTNDPTVQNIGGKWGEIIARGRNFVSMRLYEKILQYKRNSNEVHTIAVLPSRLVRTLNSSDADIIHLHWLAR